MGGNKENLKPKTSPQARGKLGGIKSAQVKKERKMLSAMYAEFLAKEHNVVVEGKSTKVSGHILAERVIAKVLSRGDSSSVRLLREMREATEGSKVWTDKPEKQETDDTANDLSILQQALGIDTRN